MDKAEKALKIQPRIPGGFLELLPGDQIAFNWMFNQIKTVFERFGFLPIETPAAELKEVLLAKGGGETDKQVYRLAAKTGETDMCLHFDLTVPLARYVAQHRNELLFPFRRYQMQKVWRGEGPQKGRYREFYQCDIDVIGAVNMLTDAEIPSVIYEVFKKLRVPKFTIRLSNRKFLNGVLETFQVAQYSNEILHIIDKVSKTGIEVAREDLLQFGLEGGKSDTLLSLISFQGNLEEFLAISKDWQSIDGLAKDGILELEMVYNGMREFGVPAEYTKIDLGVARGLDYYTGTVYETTLDDYSQIGSVCSGGRYDDLCGYYTDQNLPGVGISIGLSRLFYQLKAANLLTEQPKATARVLIIRADESATNCCMQVAAKIRGEGANCEVYLEEAKVSKQFSYASRHGIPFVIVIGETELQAGTVTLKDMVWKTQEEMPIEKAVALVTWEQRHRN